MKGGQLHCRDCSIATSRGTSPNCTATITGGSILADEITAIYWPDGESLTIGGDATVMGSTALVLSSGTFTLQDNATLIGTGKGQVESPKAGAVCIDGSALRVDSQLYSNSPIVVNLKGGTLESEHGKAFALYRSSQNEVSAQVTLAGTELKDPIAFYTDSGTDAPGVTFKNGKLEAASGNTVFTMDQSAAGGAAAVRMIENEDEETIPSLLFYSTLNDAMAGGAGDVYVLSDSGLTAQTLTNPDVRLIAAPGVKLDVTAGDGYTLVSTKNTDGGITYSIENNPLSPPTVTISLTEGTLTASATTSVPDATFTYEWYIEGYPVPLATTATYTPKMKGNYYVMVTYTVPQGTSGTLTSPAARSNSLHFIPGPTPTPTPDTTPTAKPTPDTTPTPTSTPSLTLPQTGDSTQLALYILLALLSLAVLATLLVRCRRHG